MLTIITILLIVIVPIGFRTIEFVYRTCRRLQDSVTVTEQTLPEAPPADTTHNPAGAHDSVGATIEMIRQQLDERIARFRDIADDPVTALAHPDFYPMVWDVVADDIAEAKAEALMFADSPDPGAESITAITSWADRVCDIADKLDTHADELLDGIMRAKWSGGGLSSEYVRMALRNIDTARCWIKSPIIRTDAARSARRTAMALRPELAEHVERAFDLLEATIADEAHLYYTVK